MQLTLLVTSPRVAPGLLTHAAWTAIESASQVAASSSHPLVGAVRAAGFTVAITAEPLGLCGDVVWLADDDESVRLPAALAGELVGGSTLELEVLHASYDVPGARLLDLVTVMDRLRTECPWDKEQTHRSLSKYLLEEAYETLEAIESGDQSHLREELGDLLLQVYFHARIAAEDPEAGFTIDDVAAGIVEKLVYRHPHVFAGLEVSGADEVNQNWETLKAAEKKRKSPLEGIPLALPALALADKVLGRLPQVEVPLTNDVGGRLLALVAEARGEDLDAEQELRDAVRRLIEAVDE